MRLNVCLRYGNGGQGLDMPWPTGHDVTLIEAGRNGTIRHAIVDGMLVDGVDWESTCLTSARTPWVCHKMESGMQGGSQL